MRVTYSADRVAAALGRPAPTAEQRAVIEAPLEPMLVVAGAGSGKTETMAARVVWLVANGLLAPEQVLGLTFTRKAAGELAGRIGSRLRELAAEGLWTAQDAAPDDSAATVSTYHAYAGRIVQEHGLRLGVEPDARLLTEAAAWQLAHEVVVSYDGPMDAVTHAESTVTRAVVALSGELAEHLRDVADVARFYEAFDAHVRSLPLGASRARTLPRQVRELLAVVAARRQLLPIVAAYAAAKRARDAVDFADQVALAARLARDFPGVAHHERGRYRVVLLDEFQDTSEAQLILLRSLFADPAGGQGVPVMAVGDPHQSIYGWRGASASTLARFPRLFAQRPVAAVRADVPVQETLFDLFGGVDDGGGGDDPSEPAAVAVAPEPAAVAIGRDNAAALPAAVDLEAPSPATEMAVRHLSVSWRNDERVLAVANAVAAPLTAGAALPVRRLQPAPGATDGVVEVARCETMRDEAAYVARRVADLWLRPGGGHTGVTAAVLCRRRAQFAPVVEALRDRGLPVEVVGLGGLLTMPEVQDVVALLSVVADPTRGDRLMRLLTGPAFRFGAADLDALAAWSRHLRRREQSRRHAATVEPVVAFASVGDGRTAEPPVDGAGAAEGEPEGHVTTTHDRRGAAPGEDQPSLVDAAEELPPPGWAGPEGERLSPAAQRRLTDLARMVARLRGLAGAGLADLAAEAERLLRLDVELLARPDLPAEAARVNLDAFADAAAAFQAAVPAPTLGAFLSWLDVALEEERGLESPAAGVSAEAVQVLTVHAAKGLEWDVVAVPGLVEGAFPSTGAGASSWQDGRWRLSPPSDKGWCVGLERLPYPLRGDADGLPTLEWSTAPDLATLETRLSETFAEGGTRVIAEERRLAYVAFTRARHLLVLTAPVWTDAGTPRVTSQFLTEVLDGSHGVQVARGPWAAMPEPGPDGKALRPDVGEARAAVWPHDPLAARRRLVLPGAHAWAEQVAALPDGPEVVQVLEAEVSAGAEAGRRGDVELLALLRERREQRRRPGPPVASLPPHLATSSLVAMVTDEAGFAERLRRPMPSPPAAGARSGTAFHAWIEQHYQRAAIVDIDDLPGSGDPEAPLDIADAKERFLAGEWAGRTPLELELALETRIGPMQLRGRIDAVFQVGERYVVVDWKTGRPPSGAQARAAALQLAVYRLAYARLRGLDPASVTGAFYYASTGETVYPPLPSEGEIAVLLERAGAERTDEREKASS